MGSRVVTKSSRRPLLSVIIPCFNEVSTILDLIDRVRQSPVDSQQLIVVDDGSTDGTRDLLLGLNAPDLTILLHERNKGKGRRSPLVLPQQLVRFASCKMPTSNTTPTNIHL